VDDKGVEKRRKEDDEEEEKRREDDDEKVCTPRTEEGPLLGVKSRAIEMRDIFSMENTREYMNSIRTTRKIYKHWRDCSTGSTPLKVTQKSFIHDTINPE